MYIRKVLFLVKLSLVLALCFVVVRTVIMPQHPAGIFTPASAVGTENVSADRTENSVEASVEDYSAIVERNIFGSADSSGVEYKSSRVNKFDGVAKSAEEELSLALVGTVCGSTAVSRAIIKNTKTRMLDMYKTGQSVADARIKSIEEDAVILLHNGQRKMLTLNRTGGSQKSEVRSRKSEVRSQKSEIRICPLSIANMEVILTKAVIESYAVNGQVEGLRITGLENIPMAKALGLKDGDIIRVVNGHRLTSKQKALQVFKKARLQETMSLELLRGDETKELSFALR